MEDETLEHLFAGAALQGGGGRGRLPPYDFSSDKKNKEKRGGKEKRGERRKKRVEKERPGGLQL